MQTLHDTFVCRNSNPFCEYASWEELQLTTDSRPSGLGGVCTAMNPRSSCVKWREHQNGSCKVLRVVLVDGDRSHNWVVWTVPKEHFHNSSWRRRQGNWIAWSVKRVFLRKDRTVMWRMKLITGTKRERVPTDGMLALKPKIITWARTCERASNTLLSDLA